ncbi:hypothetical protein, partial [Streptococcus pneumoniae]|uniref:hypothetical protein n=1 Tax=Streptococcus pneumoniae TaxID=1313 RepID=UPI0018B08276
PVEIAPGITRVGPGSGQRAGDINNITRTNFDLSLPAGSYGTDAPLQPATNPMPVRAVQRQRMGYAGDPDAVGTFINDTQLQVNLGVY